MGVVRSLPLGQSLAAIGADARLSVRAKGMMTMALATFADDAQIGWYSFVEPGMGRDVVRRMFNELKAAGYLEEVVQRFGNGRYAHVLDLFDSPKGQASPRPGIQGLVEQPRPEIQGLVEETAGQTSDWNPGPGEAPRPENQGLVARKDAPIPVFPQVRPRPEIQAHVVSSSSTRPRPRLDTEVLGQEQEQKQDVDTVSARRKRGPSADARDLAALLAECVSRNSGDVVGATAAWEVDADRLLRIDKRPVSEAVEVLVWCQNDQFWQSNVLSMKAFRKQYVRLRMQMTRVGGKETMGDKALRMAMADYEREGRNGEIVSSEGVDRSAELRVSANGVLRGRNPALGSGA
jgi:hypothetical protein